MRQTDRQPDSQTAAQHWTSTGQPWAAASSPHAAGAPTLGRTVLSHTVPSRPYQPCYSPRARLGERLGLPALERHRCGHRSALLLGPCYRARPGVGGGWWWWWCSAARQRQPTGPGRAAGEPATARNSPTHSIATRRKHQPASRHLHPPRPRVPGPWPCPSGYTGHLTKHASRSRADAGLQSLERQPCTSAASTPSCWKAAGRLCGLLHAEQIPAPWR